MPTMKRYKYLGKIDHAGTVFCCRCADGGGWADRIPFPGSDAEAGRLKTLRCVRCGVYLRELNARIYGARRYRVRRS